MRCQNSFSASSAFETLFYANIQKRIYIAFWHHLLATIDPFLAEPTFILDNDFRFCLAVLLASCGLLEDWICFLARSSRLIYPRTPGLKLDWTRQSHFHSIFYRQACPWFVLSFPLMNFLLPTMLNAHPGRD